MPSGKKVMSFEGFLSSEYYLFMADSGATHTFASTQYCREHSLNYAPLQANVALADDSALFIMGYIDMHIKLDGLRRKHSLGS